MLADAKAFQHIFQTSRYRFYKPNDYRTDEKMMLGPGGIGSAHGTFPSRQSLRSLSLFHHRLEAPPSQESHEPMLLHTAA